MEIIDRNFVMSMIANGIFTAIQPLPKGRGRTLKFTPDVIEQIKQWVAEGFDRHEIASRVGSSVGSLQVTCSRLGISLRSGKTAIALARVRRNSRSPSLATYSIMVNGSKTVVSLSRDQENVLALEAMMRDTTIGDLIVRMVNNALEKNLVTEIMNKG
jgi:hypothetical protein